VREVAAILALGAGCHDPTIPSGLPCAAGDPPCRRGQICDLASQICVGSAAADAPPASDDGSVDDPDALPVTDAPPGPDARPPDASSCPSGYLPLAVGSTHRYRLVSIPATWPEARDACADDGAYLAIPDTATEAMVIGVFSQGWIGITDAQVEGTWVTVSSAPAPYLGWATGEPDNDTTEAPAGQDCGVLIGGFGQLDDSYCTDARTHPFVCECAP
jgi:hypothetical protein